MSHYSVMVKSIAQLFVAGPPVVTHATGKELTKEQLGGVEIHGTNGSIDNVVESEHEAIFSIKKFLSYLPSNAWELPPRVNSSDPILRREEELLHVIPRYSRSLNIVTF